MVAVKATERITACNTACLAFPFAGDATNTIARRQKPAELWSRKLKRVSYSNGAGPPTG